MTFELKVDPCPVPGKCQGIYLIGDHVTKAVHQKISAIMANNLIDNEFYKTRTKVGAFFQGGYQDPDGQFIFIELLPNRDPQDILDFENLLTREVSPLIGSALTEIRIAPNTQGAYYFIVEIAKETDCRYHPGDSLSPIVFHPEDSVQWLKVFRLCNEMGLTIANHKFR